MKNRSKFRFIMATITYACTVLAYIIECRRVPKYEDYDEYEEW